MSGSIEPLRSIRVRLEPSQAQPIAFKLLFQAIVPPVVEEREDRRTLVGYRHTAHQIRYHQTGTAKGWVEVEGKKSEIDPATWISTRDHSWGIRPEVGAPLTDLQPAELAVAPSALAIWNPVFFERPDGSRYAMHHYYLRVEFPGGFVHEKFQGGVFHFAMADGTERSLEVEVIGDTGFHLGTGLYHGFDGHHHGGWRGKLHVEGEHILDCSQRETAERVHQIRDCVVRVSDPAGGGSGWGNCQTVALGAWPRFGLDDVQSSFL